MNIFQNWKEGFLKESKDNFVLYGGMPYSQFEKLINEEIANGRSYDIKVPALYLTKELSLAARCGIHDIFELEDSKPVILEIHNLNENKVKKVLRGKQDEHDENWYDENSYFNSKEIIDIFKLENSIKQLLKEFNIEISWNIFPESLEHLNNLNIIKVIKNIIPNNPKLDEIENKLKETIFKRSFNSFSISEEGIIQLSNNIFSRRQMYYSDKIIFSDIKFFYVREKDFSETPENYIESKTNFGFKVFPNETKEFFDKLSDFLEDIVKDEVDVFEKYDEDMILDIVEAFPGYEELGTLLSKIWESNNKRDILRRNIDKIKQFYDHLNDFYGEELELDSETVWLKIKNRFNMRINLGEGRRIFELDRALKHNRKFLANLKDKLEPELISSILINIDEVEPLHEHKLVKFLGNGYYGLVFLLDSDRVIKFYFVGNQKDAEIHDKLADKLYSGEDVNPSDLPVFDTKTIKEEGYRNFTYTVMPKLLPIKDYFKMISSDLREANRKEWAYYKLSVMFVNALEQNNFIKPEHPEEFLYSSIKNYYEQETIKKIVQILRKPLIEAIVEMFAAAIRTYDVQKLDIHINNVGALTSTIFTDNVVLIAFDA